METERIDRAQLARAGAGRGVEFHQIEAEGGRNPLMDVAAFRAFQEDIAERCEEPPAPTNLREVGSYGFWSG